MAATKAKPRLSRFRASAPPASPAIAPSLEQRLCATGKLIAARLLPLRFKRHVNPKPSGAAPASAALHALTAAAVALPGLMLSTAQAADGDEAGFQYGLYEEGQRTLLMSYDTLHLQPIRVDNFSAGGKTTFFDRWKFAFNYTQDTWSGATPLTTAPAASMFLLQSGASMAIQSNVLIDKQTGSFFQFDPNTGKPVQDNRSVHMMTMASPETRKQGDFRLGYEWDEAALDVGGGVSVEDDYNSHFINGNGRFDFNRKLTTLNVGMSYTDSLIRALRDPQYTGYIDYTTDFAPGELSLKTASGQPAPLRGEREDWSAHLGLTQVLSKNSVFDGGVNFTRSTGFLSNPYKVAEFIFVDPSQTPNQFGLFTGQTQGVLERRPNERSQWTLSARYKYYVAPLDAALHLGYTFFHDDWGINAHTFEAAWAQSVGWGWTVTPRVRYYSQNAADFYRPYFVFNQAQPSSYNKLPIDAFSSDQRLSGYGALSGGVTISKQFAKGINLDAGFEYYTHQGGLKLNGGGEDSYANFSYYQISAALRVNFEALSNLSGGDHGGHAGHAGHTILSGHAPAGVLFDHMMDKAGSVMVGYRFMYSPQNGDMYHGSNTVSDKTIVANACGTRGCSVTPVEHNMYMHMIDIMYAPTDWLTLMLMPQFMDMDMTLRPLDGGVPEEDNGGHHHGGGGNATHATGGIGDTGMYALVKLLDKPGHHIHMALGLSAPSGDVTQKINGQNLTHYGMQLGSGTWDFRPSLTYTGYMDRWSWGAQISGTKRLQDRNEVGFAFGDIFQSTVWGGYSLTNWLSATVRGIYTQQGEIKNAYDQPHDIDSPPDYPSNYGGRFWDVGVGLNAVVTGGQFQGNRFAFEWLQPVHDSFNGYQLQREGGLAATWSLAF